MGVLDAPPAPYAPARPQPTRALAGRVLFVEDFADGSNGGMFNDGIGSTCVDWNIRFGGRPTMRLDPQTTSSTPSAGNTLALTLGGSTASYTQGGSGTLVGTTTQAGSPASVIPATGYIMLDGKATACTSDGNTYILTYTAAVVSGSTGAWTVTFTGVALAVLPGQPGGGATSCTTANVGSGKMQVGNPAKNPGSTPNTNGVIFKRRINDGFSGRFGHEMWARPTSSSSAGATQTSLFTQSMYNRDGNNWWGGRVFLMPGVTQSPGAVTTDTAIVWILTGTSSTAFQWVPVGFLNSGFSQHSWDPVNGSWDTAGGWNYLKLVVDFSVHEYVSVQVNDEVYTSMAGLPIYQGIGDTGAKMMHFSTELIMTTSTRRFWNVAQVTGTLEA